MINKINEYHYSKILIKHIRCSSKRVGPVHGRGGRGLQRSVQGIQHTYSHIEPHL